MPYRRRIFELSIKILAPITGSSLPILLLSHSHVMSNNHSSLNAYSPLTNFWAAHGFVVIQPTHLSSKSLLLQALSPTTSGVMHPSIAAPESKILALSLTTFPISNPWSRRFKADSKQSRIAVAGHSLGGHTAAILLGATLTDLDTRITHSLANRRIRAGIVIAAPGNGGSDLSDFVYEKYHSLHYPSFAETKTKALVIVGDQEISPFLNKRGAD